MGRAKHQTLERDSDQLLSTRSLITFFSAVEGNGSITVLNVRVVGARRETKDNVRLPSWLMTERF